MHWAAAMLFAGSQVLSPPRDGDIRVEYSDLLRQTVVALTLTIEPPHPGAESRPLVLTFGRTFDGQVPQGPAALFDVRASAAPAATPPVELWLIADGERIDLVGGNPEALRKTDEADSIYAHIPAETLKRLAAAGLISGNALGFGFELTASPRAALRTFVARAMSADPARAK
jgi:hypothetical protein